MKRILMIGAGIGQKSLAHKIKDRGDYLITVTLPGKQPVIEIADRVCYHDVFDKEGVLQIAKEEQIDGVISDQNDTMMPTVAYVAENLNLPGLRTDQVDSYCNKNHFRDNCDKLGIPVPKHVEVRDIRIPESFANTPYPWIVKPADSQSSVGVEKVNNEKECLVAIEKALGYSKSHSAILEEFFDGRELVAEGFIYHGKYYNLGFADRYYFALDKLFIPAQTIFPSMVDEKILAKITACESRMANHIKPEFAIVHSEYLYNTNNGEYRVVESALRGGGVYISSHIVPLYTGIDINDALLDCVEGNKIDIQYILSKRNNKAAGYICFYLPEGKITNITGLEELYNMDCVRMVTMDDLKVGDMTHPLTHKGQRLGPIILTGRDREDINKNICLVKRTLNVRVEGKNGNESGIKWN